MADPQLLQVPRQQDKAILKCFRKIIMLHESATCSLNVIGSPSLGTVDLKQKNETIDYLEKNNTSIIETANINIGGFTIIFHRGGLPYFRSEHREKSPFYDEIAFNTNDQNSLKEKQKLEIATLVSKELMSIHPSRSVGKLSAEQTQLEAIHTATLERLESLNENLISETHNYREKIDEQYSSKKEILDAEYSQKIKDLESGVEEEQEALEAKQKSLDLLRKTLDDRNNTHARREIRKDILKEIKNRQTKFSLTDGTNDLRKPVSIMMMCLIILFVALASASVFEFYTMLNGNDYNKIIISGLKQLVYSGGAIGSILYLIKWKNRWFERHATAEFQLKQFELDMERASWLVETSLEWKDAKGTAIPTELLSCLSNNLFSNENSKLDPLLHPADQLASALMGSASAIKLKAGDSSIEIDPKKLIKSNNESKKT